MDPCECGSRLFVRTIQCYGTWTEFLTLDTEDGSLELSESNTDDVKFRQQPKTIKCEECGKRVPNPDC